MTAAACREVTILHDIGLTASVSGPNRFEVNGADAARSFIKGRGVSDRRVQLIWDLIALNSTPSLALHKEPEVAVGTMGIGLDYGGFGLEALPAGDVERILSAFSTSADEGTICRGMLSARQGKAGVKWRQFSSRLRRTVRVKADAPRRQHRPLDFLEALGRILRSTPSVRMDGSHEPSLVSPRHVVICYRS